MFHVLFLRRLVQTKLHQHWASTIGHIYRTQFLIACFFLNKTMHRPSQFYC